MGEGQRAGTWLMRKSPVEERQQSLCASFGMRKWEAVSGFGEHRQFRMRNQFVDLDRNLNRHERAGVGRHQQSGNRKAPTRRLAVNVRRYFLILFKLSPGLSKKRGNSDRRDRCYRGANSPRQIEGRCSEQKSCAALAVQPVCQIFEPPKLGQGYAQLEQAMLMKG